MSKASNDERARRWRTAANEAMDGARPIGLAMMAVADQEQAVLREGLAEVNRDVHNLERALAKERAKVARVEALLAAAESSAREARIREPRRVSIAAVRTELDEQ